jgi:hypothetical protein
VLTENNTLRTFRFRLKGKQSAKRLTAAAHTVNVVWNHCNGAQVQALTRNDQALTHNDRNAEL